MANVITCLRIVLSLSIIFVPAFSNPFFILYLSAGFSDIIDGPIARLTHSESDFGSKLDTAADIVMVVFCGIKILPVIELQSWIVAWIIAIAIIKAVSFAICWARQRKLVSEHTILNKATGLLLFVFPLTIGKIDLRYTACVICAVATVAAIQEQVLIRKAEE